MIKQLKFKIGYRPEIDFFRAISVILVFAFHTELLKSGFIGVDLFFVISGFLISSIILKDISTNRFSLKNFFNRRIRRIWPMLILLIFLALLINFFIMDPTQYKEFLSTAIGSTLGIGNFVFYNLQNDYFSESANLITLIHTWSLSVEEQFYIIFSIIIFVCLNLKIKDLVKKIFILCVIIFIIGFIYIFYYPFLKNNFYLTQYRILPILLGIITSIIYNTDIIFRKKYLNKNLSIIAFIFIVVYIFIFELYYETFLRNLSFNYSLVPSILLCLFIYSYKKNILSKFIFENKYIVYLGLISYSFYLIHFFLIANLFVIYENFLGINFDFNVQNIILIFTSSIILSLISWKYIELKFRDKKQISDKLIFKLFFLSLIIVICYSSISYFKNGYPDRFIKSEYSKKFEEAKNAYSPFRENCTNQKFKFDEINYCILGNANKPSKIALIGDSFMEHYETAFNKLGNKNEFSIVNFLNCRNFENLFKKKECIDIPILIEEKNIDKIVISYRWMHRFIDLETGLTASKEFVELRKKNLIKYINHLNEIAEDIYLIYPIPEFEINVPRVLLMKNYLFKTEEKTILKINKKYFLQSNTYAFSTLNKIKNINRIFPHKQLCDEDLINGYCYSNNEDLIFYYNRNHLTNEKAEEIILDVKNVNLLLKNLF